MYYIIESLISTIITLTGPSQAVERQFCPTKPCILLIKAESLVSIHHCLLLVDSEERSPRCGDEARQTGVKAQEASEVDLLKMSGQVPCRPLFIVTMNSSGLWRSRLMSWFALACLMAKQPPALTDSLRHSR
jgi:hypothetical protein